MGLSAVMCSIYEFMDIYESPIPSHSSNVHSQIQTLIYKVFTLDITG